jgi:metal-sulfur cluster biosynthetic enzyme
VDPHTSSKLHLVWDPPWDKDMMSDAAKLTLGID